MLYCVGFLHVSNLKLNWNAWVVVPSAMVAKPELPSTVRRTWGVMVSLCPGCLPWGHCRSDDRGRTPCLNVSYSEPALDMALKHASFRCSNAEEGLSPSLQIALAKPRKSDKKRKTGWEWGSPEGDQISLLWSCSCSPGLWHTQTPSLCLLVKINAVILGTASPSSLLGDACIALLLVCCQCPNTLMFPPFLECFSVEQRQRLGFNITSRSRETEVMLLKLAGFLKNEKSQWLLQHLKMCFI